MRWSLAFVTVVAVSCGQGPGPLQISPNAVLAPPATTVAPPPGPFDGDVTLTFSTDRDATIFVTTDGSDPRTQSATRLSGAAPFTVKLTATSTVKYFASANGKDEDLQTGQWVRAGGPVGTITGVVVTGSFVDGELVGLSNNGQTTVLGTPATPTELPFRIDMVKSGTYRLSALADRNGDGLLIPIIDYQSDTTTITIDLTDPFKASAENVRITLGTSGSGLGTLKGIIALPKPPAFQNLQMSVLSPSMFSGAAGGTFDPAALLQQLQGGYRIFTNQTDMQYPYVVTNLTPGSYIPVPSLFGFGSGGIALNLIANLLQPAVIQADHETIANFAFGPVTIGGQVTLSPTASPTGGLALGIVAARAISLTEGTQAVLMPVLFMQDPMTMSSKGSYSGACFRGNATVTMRVFTNANGANPLTDALGWVVNPFGALPAHATVATGMTDVTQDIVVP